MTSLVVDASVGGDPASGSGLNGPHATKTNRKSAQRMPRLYYAGGSPLAAIKRSGAERGQGAG